VSITLEEAYAVIDAAIAKAVELDQPMCVAVVDAGANLVAFTRMDDAWIGSIKIAQDKAWTAKAFDISTGRLGGESQPKGQFYGIQNSNDGRVMIFGGGVPIIRDGQVIGAIGVSGGTGEQDVACADAGVAVIS